MEGEVPLWHCLVDGLYQAEVYEAGDLFIMQVHGPRRENYNSIIGIPPPPGWGTPEWSPDSDLLGDLYSPVAVAVVDKLAVLGKNKGIYTWRQFSQP